MVRNKLKKLSRVELTELLLEQMQENQRLQVVLARERGMNTENTDATGETDSGLEQLQAELARKNYKKRYYQVLKSTIFTLITVAAVAVLVATLWLPVLQIYGSSMTPTLQNGEIVFSIRSSDFESGDIIAFYYNNKILIKRVICGPGDWLRIDEDGTVYVNERKMDEPYVVEKALGDCNIEMPYQVPDGKVFVMGDHRSTSVDSRNTSVGCVAQEQVVGKVVFRIWPLSSIGGL